MKSRPAMRTKEIIKTLKTERGLNRSRRARHLSKAITVKVQEIPCPRQEGKFFKSCVAKLIEVKCEYFIYPLILVQLYRT